MTEVDREALGRMVRDEWIRWAREQPDPKPSWLVPWDDLPERDREVDRRIGERLHSTGRAETVADERQRALNEAADEVHREAAWQEEQFVRSTPIQQNARLEMRDRLLMVEQILRDRAAGSVPVATPDREAAGVREEVNLADQFMPPSAQIGDQEARRLGLMVTRPVATPTQQAEQLGDPYSLGDWINQTPPAPALLEPVADAIGQAMTTRQGPPEIAARAMAAAAPAIVGMCHWVQNRGTARAETHQAFHYGSPCPYEAMAAVLRGEPDPRETTDPEAAEPAGGGALQLAAARAEVTDARAALGRLIAADDERHRAMEPGSLGYAQQIAEQRGDLADAADEDGMD